MCKEEIYEKRAKRILIKDGFVQAFYYVKKVLESFKTCSCMKSTSPTYLWGRERLSAIRDQILEKYEGKSFACHIRFLCNSYIRQLADIDIEVLYALRGRYGTIGVWNLESAQKDNTQQDIKKILL